MTRVEYELLSDNRPDLKLPFWVTLWPGERDRVDKMTQEQNVVWVTEQHLIGNFDWHNIFKGSSRRMAFS